MSKTVWMAFAAMTVTLALPAPATASGHNCNNYGFAVNTYIDSPPDCSSHEYVQYCDQGTGAGAAGGAGSGAGGGNKAEVEASAGTRCSQNNGNQTGNHTRENGVGGPTLDKLPVTDGVNDLADGIYLCGIEGDVAQGSDLVVVTSPAQVVTDGKDGCNEGADSSEGDSPPVVAPPPLPAPTVPQLL